MRAVVAQSPPASRPRGLPPAVSRVPIVAATFACSPKPRVLCTRVARQRCHKRNNNDKSKRDKPVADRRSTRRRECVGAHFACGCFKQWESGYFSDSKVCAITEAKARRAGEKSGEGARNLREVIRMFFESLLSRFLHPYNLITISYL